MKACSSGVVCAVLEVSVRMELPAIQLYNNFYVLFGIKQESKTTTYYFYSLHADWATIVSIR